jgi:dihydroorotase
MIEVPPELLLRNGIVIRNGAEATRSVAVQTGKIAGIYETGQEPHSETVVDCSGLYILPGAIDMHVHLRDLGEADKEDYSSGTKAAAAGGVTTVVDMPNSKPPVLSQEVLAIKIERAKKRRYVNVGFYAGIPANISDFHSRMKQDILGLKVYPHSPLANGVKYDMTSIKSCMQLARQNDLPLLFHPDASDPMTRTIDIQQFFGAHSCMSEMDSISAFIAAQKETGARVHVCHVSCASSARLITNARAEDRLTAEVTPHHLFLSGADFTNVDGTAKVLPPLRSPNDNWVLKDSLLKGAIDVVASDHAPHATLEKKRHFMNAPSGIPGLETTVPLLLTEVFEGRLSWVEYLRVCSSGPARILGLIGKGLLSEGYDADLTVVAKEDWTVKGKEFHSKAKITPFEGRGMSAKPVMTIVAGEIVYDYGKFRVGPGNAGTVPVRSIARPRNT